MLENGHKYGFIHRYPASKVELTGISTESWHFRYVGVEVATYIYENNLCFEEYYAMFLDK
jgi:D-alanyl-D-alanine carboxypeptidase